MPKGCFFSICPPSPPLVPCPLRFVSCNLNCGRGGSQVPEESWKNQDGEHKETKTIACFGDPPLAGRLFSRKRITYPNLLVAACSPWLIRKMKVWEKSRENPSAPGMIALFPGSPFRNPLTSTGNSSLSLKFFPKYNNRIN